MNQEQLQHLVEQVSQEFFCRPFLHQAVFNSRLRTTGGRYLMKSHDLEMNPRVLQMYDEKELIGVIKHELCHYHLHLEGKGYQHKDRDFKELLQKSGGSRYVKDLRSKEDIQQENVYQCSRCNQVYRRKKKMDTRRYVCGKCRGRLLLVKGE